jgi:NADH-quinone oxidoreductase subunit A
MAWASRPLVGKKLGGSSLPETTIIDTAPLWPLVVYFLVILGTVAFQIILSHFLGPRHNERATGTPYESGIISEGSAQLRFSATFYLVAMFFVVFDLEAVYIIAWAIGFQDLGWSGYLKTLVFVLILLASLVYLWKVGALEAGPAKRKQRQVE